MKILHGADWHLRESDIEEAEKCLNMMIDTAGREEVDLIAIAGDIFDSRDIKLDSKAARLAIKAVSALASIAPVAIVLGTPSHDGSAPEILQYAKGEYPIYVASRPTQIIIENGEFAPAGFRNEKIGQDPDAVITLIPQTTKQFFQTNSDIKTADQEISAAMSQVFAGFGAMASEYDCPHILIGHWNVKGAKLSNTQTLTGMDIEMTVEQMMLCNPDLICLGHIHKAQQLGDRTFYAGSLYSTNWGEMEAKGFYIQEYSPEDSLIMPSFDFRFVETPTRKLVRVSVDMINKVVKGEPDLEHVAGAYVRIDQTVWQDEAASIDKEEIRKIYLDAGALDVDIRIIRKPRETVRSETVLKVETLREKLIAMAELKGETVPESILDKAMLLECTAPDEIISALTAGEKVEAA